MIDVRSFIQHNIISYQGDESFLAPATERTQRLWQQVSELMKLEQEKGILDLDVNTPSTITSHKPGYINQNEEITKVVASECQ